MILRFIHAELYGAGEFDIEDFKMLKSLVDKEKSDFTSIVVMIRYCKKVYPVMKLKQVDQEGFPSKSEDIKKFFSKMFEHMFRSKWFSGLSSYKGQMNKKYNK
mmetsp:Transcript_43433/g.51110  ORF Transcript_43433/g.51110 Transcript_43433/m.51110 type:complete len:103 (+) Transcript_43433:1059-1367(+)